MWHERLLLAPLDIGRREWIIETPDGDTYAEVIDGTEDAVHYCLLGDDGSRPYLADDILWRSLFRIKN